MASDLVHIYSAGSPYVAELVRQMLTDRNIQSFIINKQDSAYKFGDIELFVHRDEVIRAKMLIREFEEN
ncbi:MAG: DUF2007 domain-containing protein [Bacteroidales bacterium]|nr:DUF2007 domain-containing protein [Bacteroidales bacterium]